MPNIIMPQTLFEKSGIKLQPATLADSILIIIDAQREYTEGALPLHNIKSATAQLKELLNRARAAGTPVIHVVHHAKPGAPLFNPESQLAEVIPELKPVNSEPILIKTMPSSFTKTELNNVLKGIGRKKLILTGFMTHMCVSTTARAALELGYEITVIADCTATRDLPDGSDGIVSATDLQRATLAELRDRFAIIVKKQSDIQER